MAVYTIGIQGLKRELTMTIGPYTYEEYLEQVRRFHGHIAPGMVIGGFMVDLALKNLPEGEFFDALCETGACLPDAIQLLTPCTIGNGWLKVINMGRYALTLYEKFGGRGVRVYVNAEKTDAWPELKSWYFKLKPKKEQDFDSSWLKSRMPVPVFAACGACRWIRILSRCDVAMGSESACCAVRPIP